MRILVTGVAGFIASHFARFVLETEQSATIVGFSRCSDQKNLRRLGPLAHHGNRLQVVFGDLMDPGAVSGLCEGIDVVVNFAAKTFVDHSLRDPGPFIQSNILGANALMDEATRQGVKRFVQVSTDEVYGQILEGAYKEDATLNPRNPYAWTKACADLDAIWRHRTYGFPAIVTRTENNFGPWQHRQKVLPTFVREAKLGHPLPVYGDGMHVRCWLYVMEHCAAIWHLIEHGKVGEVYHIAGEEELTNLDLARFVLRTLGQPIDRIKFIEDRNIRPGHDRRYALDCSKLKATGFEIKQDLQQRLWETINWYSEHLEWLL